MEINQFLLDFILSANLVRTWHKNHHFTPSNSIVPHQHFIKQSNTLNTHRHQISFRSVDGSHRAQIQMMVLPSEKLQCWWFFIFILLNWVLGSDSMWQVYLIVLWNAGASCSYWRHKMLCLCQIRIECFLIIISSVVDPLP